MRRYITFKGTILVNYRCIKCLVIVDTLGIQHNISLSTLLSLSGSYYKNIGENSSYIYVFMYKTHII